MNILLDENLKGKEAHFLNEKLKQSGHDVVWVSEHDETGKNLMGKGDPELGRIATQDGRLVVTHDVTTFQRDNFREQQTLPYGLLGLRLGTDLSVENRVERTSSFINERGESLHGQSTILEPGNERTKPMEQAYHEYQESQQAKQQQAAQENTQQADAQQQNITINR